MLKEKYVLEVTDKQCVQRKMEWMEYSENAEESIYKLNELEGLHEDLENKHKDLTNKFENLGSKYKNLVNKYEDSRDKYKDMERYIRN